MFQIWLLQTQCSDRFTLRLSSLHSLIYRYFIGKCPVKIHFLVPQVQTFTAGTLRDTSTESNYPHRLCGPNLRKKFNPAWMPRTDTLWNASKALKISQRGLNAVR